MKPLPDRDPGEALV